MGMRPRLASHTPLPGTTALEGTAKPQATGKLLHGQQIVAPFPMAPSCFGDQFSSLPADSVSYQI